MAAFNPQAIVGNWRSGYALDLHTTSSTYLGEDADGRRHFDTVYSELGSLLHRLKYSGDQTAAPEIVKAAVEFLRPKRTFFDLIVPTPASTPRAVQPVSILAEGIGAALRKPVVFCVWTTRPTAQLKSIVDPEKRKEALAGLYAVDASRTTGQNVLLFDDLFRSGSTMNAITDVLLEQGQTANVYVLAVTQTRTHR